MGCALAARAVGLSSRLSEAAVTESVPRQDTLTCSAFIIPLPRNTNMYGITGVRANASLEPVIPAQAGIQAPVCHCKRQPARGLRDDRMEPPCIDNSRLALSSSGGGLDSRLRGNDELERTALRLRCHCLDNRAFSACVGIHPDRIPLPWQPQRAPTRGAPTEFRSFRFSGKVPSPSGGGLGWGRIPGVCEAVVKQDFTLTPTFSLKGDGESKDPATELDVPKCRDNPCGCPGFQAKERQCQHILRIPTMAIPFFASSPALLFRGQVCLRNYGAAVAHASGVAPLVLRLNFHVHPEPVGLP